MAERNEAAPAAKATLAPRVAGHLGHTREVERERGVRDGFGDEVQKEVKHVAHAIDPVDCRW